MSHISRNKFLYLGTFAFFLLFWTVSITFAQQPVGKARITGIAVDETGQPLEGVLIVAEGVTYKTKYERYTSKKGRFTVLGLATGQWRITATKKGYTSSYVNMRVQQLKKSPPITFTLKKITSVAAPVAYDDEYAQLFAKGNLLIKEEKYDEALAVFEKVLEKHPKIYQCHLNIGTCYLKKGELDKAEAEFKMALDKILENGDDYKKDAATSYFAFTELGALFILKGDFESAQKYFSLAVDISPQKELTAFNAGLDFFAHQQFDEAIKFFELAIQIKKDWSKPYIRLGYIYLQKGDFEKSFENFTLALDLSPDDERAAYDVAEVFFSNQRIDEAIRYFELAIQIKEDWSAPYMRLGFAYLNKGDFDKSLEYFNKFIELDPEHPEVTNVKNIITTIEKIKK